MHIRNLCFLFLFVSVPTFSAPPFSGTVFVNVNIITSADPSSFVKVEAAGKGRREMYDRRANNGQGAWVWLDAILFNAFYTDGNTIEIQVNPEFNATEAADKARFYGHAIGQLPSLLRIDVKTVWLHKGDKAFGGGNNNLLIHTDAAGYHGVWLEETLFHEACHTSLDSRLANASAWLSAQFRDNEFISTYARDYPLREDVSESCLPYFATKFRADRMPENYLTTIRSTIPNRIAIMDTLGMAAIVESDRPSSFLFATGVLHIPAVKVGDEYYEVTMKLVDLASGRFTLETAKFAVKPSYALKTEFSDNILDIPLVLVDGIRYAVRFSLTKSDPMEFTLISASELK
ncbi:MAG: hypothetical protein Q8S94_12015 [Pseudohongiella sp.]|nr:hypothetical protein [Pseudohongiella sp.]